MKPVNVALFDLDRTLFDTERFFNDVWSFIADEYGVDKQYEINRTADFHTYINQWYDYDFFGHIRSIRMITDSSKDFTKKACAVLENSYLFDDATAVIDECDAVVTFGNEPFQSFKLRFVGPFAQKPIHIIHEEKADYIARVFSDKSVLLVDDKPLEQTLRGDMRFIRIDRTMEVSVQRTSQRTATMRSLDDYRSALRLIEAL